MKRIAIRMIGLLAMAGGIAAAAGTAHAAGEIFLCLGKLSIKSEKFELPDDCIEIDSVGYGISRDSGGLTGEKSLSTANFSEVQIAKPVDPVFSPWFISSAVAGAIYDEINIQIGVPTKFNIILFKAAVSAISTSAVSGGTPVEAVTFVFQKQQVIFPPPN